LANGFGDAALLDRIGYIKIRVRHAEGIEDVLLLELIERLAGSDLDDPAENVGGVTVFQPCLAETSAATCSSARQNWALSNSPS